MAASPVYRRYTSAVYEDKYFPEKNARIPFKWETTPGRPKEDDENDNHEAHAAEHDHEAHAADTGMHIRMSDQSCSNYCKQADHQYLQESCIHIPQAVSIYPLPPPPKLSPPSPLRVKDLLQHEGAGDNALFDDDDDDDQLQQLSTAFDHCPLHAYHHGFSRLSLHFRSLKASGAVVPLHKNYCVIKPRQNSGLQKSQASPLVISGAPFQGRSQSFNHAAMHSAAASKRANINVIADAQASDRRCNSFNLQSERRCSSFNLQSTRRTVFDQDSHNNIADDHPSIAAAAMWAGACILAAAAVAQDVVDATDHHHHDPCRVAMKLRDLMQQSANFSELGLPSMMKVKNGGGSTINESVAQLALCRAATTVAPAKRKTKSMAEEEIMEAFLLRDGMMPSCTHDDVEDESKKKVVTLGLARVNDDHPHKSVKSKGFFQLFKNECIACLCPSPTQ